MSQNTSPSEPEAVLYPSGQHKVLIDTDIGDDIDDALALALALHSPEITLQGVTTVFGDTQRRAQLATHLLQVFGRTNIPVAAGVGMPLQLRHAPSGVPQAAVLDNVTLPALSPLTGPELIIQTALAHPRELTLLCIGPLTNIATALHIEPQLSTSIRNIVLMGGSSGIPLPEWNVRSDVRAAQIVLASGIPVTLIGMNVTVRCQLRNENIKQLRHHCTPQTQLLSDLLEIWQRHHPQWHPKLPYLHDPLTVVALCQPNLLKFQEIPVRVFARSLLQGWMVPRLLNGPLVHAAVDIHAVAAREWVMRRLLI